MNTFEKFLFCIICYAQAFFLTGLILPMLDGLGQTVWIIFNLYFWIISPVLIMRYKGESEKEDSNWEVKICKG